MRALVTGADGFLGANLCKALIDAGHEVTGTSLNRKEFTSFDALNVKCRMEYGDVTDPAFVERVVSDTEAQWVFHLAAVAIVRVAQASPRRAMETNIMGTVNVLEACRHSPHVEAVVVASSDKAYGDHGGMPYVETMPLLPVAPYEVSKAAADLIAQSYATTYGMRVIVTRCANLYGPGDLNWSRLIPNSCRQAVMGGAPVVHAGSESMLREYLHVADACEAYMLLAGQGSAGPYNVGSGQMATTMDVASAIALEMHAPAPEVEPKGADFKEIPVQFLCSDRLLRMGWAPWSSMRPALRHTVSWYRDYLRCM